MLLIYANPAVGDVPVAPLGMERVAGALVAAGCSVQMLAPFLESDPLAAVLAAMAQAPAMVGFSLRNLDDALVVRDCTGPGDIDTDFYLDQVRPLVAAAIGRVGTDRVLLGGTGLSAGCVPVLRYLGASWAIRGPAEDLMPALAAALVAGEGMGLPADPRVVRLQDAAAGLPAHRSPPLGAGQGRDWVAGQAPTPRMSAYLSLAIARGAHVPVLASMGCNRRCNFCVEARFAGQSVVPRPVDAVVAEVDALAAQGVRRFWLACSELNVPHERHALALLGALAGRPGLQFQVFLQPAPVSDALLDALQAVGTDPADICWEFGHLDPGLLRQGAGPANQRQIDWLVELYLRRGHPTLSASILLGSHPQETWETVDQALGMAMEIDQAFPEGFCLSYATGGRVYPESPLADALSGDWPAALPHLYTRPGDTLDRSFVRPVVHCRPVAPRQLLAAVQEALKGARGTMGAMNTEGPRTVAEKTAERCLNQGLWRLHHGQAQAAADLFAQALDRVPHHLEALAQHGMVHAHQLGRPAVARHSLDRLSALLQADDPRAAEVQQTLAWLAPL